MGFGVCAGGLLQGLMFPTEGGLGRLGNSIAWWLGIRPYELFLYVFLPPLLLDAAVRIDWFLFKKVLPSPAPADKPTLAMSCIDLVNHPHL